MKAPLLALALLLTGASAVHGSDDLQRERQRAEEAKQLAEQTRALERQTRAMERANRLQKQQNEDAKRQAISDEIEAQRIEDETRKSREAALARSNQQEAARVRAEDAALTREADRVAALMLEQQAANKKALADQARAHEAEIARVKAEASGPHRDDASFNAAVQRSAQSIYDKVPAMADKTSPMRQDFDRFLAAYSNDAESDQTIFNFDDWPVVMWNKFAEHKRLSRAVAANL